MITINVTPKSPEERKRENTELEDKIKDFDDLMRHTMKIDAEKACNTPDERLAANARRKAILFIRRKFRESFVDYLK